jgi:hypothetical protein
VRFDDEQRCDREGEQVHDSEPFRLGCHPRQKM